MLLLLNVVVLQQLTTALLPDKTLALNSTEGPQTSSHFLYTCHFCGTHHFNADNSGTALHAAAAAYALGGGSPACHLCVAVLYACSTCDGHITSPCSIVLPHTYLECTAHRGHRLAPPCKELMFASTLSSSRCRAASRCSGASVRA